MCLSCTPASQEGDDETTDCIISKRENRMLLSCIPLYANPFFLGGGGVFGVFNYKINSNSTDRLMTLKSKRSEKFLFCCFCQGFQVYLQWGISTFHFMNMQLHQKYMFGFGFGSCFSIRAVWFGTFQLLCALIFFSLNWSILKYQGSGKAIFLACLLF